jgi:hypothetical protein
MHHRLRGARLVARAATAAATDLALLVTTSFLHVLGRLMVESGPILGRRPLPELRKTLFEELDCLAIHVFLVFFSSCSMNFRRDNCTGSCRHGQLYVRATLVPQKQRDFKRVIIGFAARGWVHRALLDPYRLGM